MDEEDARAVGLDNEMHIEILSILKKQLYTRGGKKIKQVVTPFPAPRPKPRYIGSARRDLVIRWTESQVQAFLELNNLGMYKKNFAAKNVDGGMLMQLDEHYIQNELGIKDDIYMTRLGSALDWYVTKMTAYCVRFLLSH
jgi:hypothetical protein